jgi:hypothetical protein
MLTRLNDALGEWTYNHVFLILGVIVVGLVIALAAMVLAFAWS